MWWISHGDQGGRNSLNGGIKEARKGILEVSLQGPLGEWPESPHPHAICSSHITLGTSYLDSTGSCYPMVVAPWP